MQPSLATPHLSSLEAIETSEHLTEQADAQFRETVRAESDRMELEHRMLHHPFPTIHESVQAERVAVGQALRNASTLSATRRLNRLVDCCAVPWLVARPGGDMRLSLGRCRDRLCPTCQAARSAHTADRVKELIQPWDTVRHIVLTVASSNAPLDQQLVALIASFRALRRTKRWKENVRACVGTIEITLNDRTHQWHPHLHVLATGEYYAQRQLQDDWSHQQGQPSIVHISAVHNRRSAARYIAKYVAKPAEMAKWPPKLIIEYAEATARKRLIIVCMPKEPPGTTERPPADSRVKQERVTNLWTIRHALQAKIGEADRFMTIARRSMPQVAYLIEGPPPESVEVADTPNEDDAAELKRLAAKLEHWISYGFVEFPHKTRRPEPMPTLWSSSA